MKNQILLPAITAFVISALTSALILIGFYYFFKPNAEQQTHKIEHVDASPAKGVVYTIDETGEVVPLDFTKPAEKVMDAVVHIRSSQTVSASRGGGVPEGRELPDPFRDFFGDEFFERFFGPRYERQERGQPSPNPRARVGSGSGVIINDSGYIVTNNHVIDRADDIEVTLYDNRSYKASVIGTDPTTDLALVKIDESNLPTLPMVNSDDVKVGEWVLAVGNPFNLNSTVTAGIISAKARNINILQDQYAIESFIQTDAAINPGNSGGALVNLQGGLIGINTAIASPTGAYSGYGFAVPSNIVNKVVEDLLKYGEVQRGYIGAMIRSVDGALVREKSLKVNTGVYVDSLMENSAAKEGGIKEGDVIVEINGRKVNSNPDLMGVIAQHRPGDKLSVKVDRKGVEKQFDVTLKNQQGTTDMVAEMPGVKRFEELGASFQTLDKSKAKELGIDGGVQLKKLYPGKLRMDTNIKEGFIITKIDGKPVKKVEDLEKELKGKSGGVLLEGIYEGGKGTQYYGFGL